MSETLLPSEKSPSTAYVPLARRCRPSDLRQMIGQEAMIRTLENAFALGRIPQAVMLSGVRGVGKTSTARILARALLFSRAASEAAPAVDEPSLDMSPPGIHCDAIIRGRHVDVTELDAASNTGVDAVRELIERAAYAPALARFRVFIIDEVHMLSKGAFNALLKTLEEPPEHVKFIFATTEIQRVPATILSRCMRFDLCRVEERELARYLATIAEQEGCELDDEVLATIAAAGDGSVRDALSILESALVLSREEAVSADALRQNLGFANPSQVGELFASIVHGDAANALRQLQHMTDRGADPTSVISALSDHIHNISRCKVLGGGDSSSWGGDGGQAVRQMAQQLSVPYLTRCWQIAQKGFGEMRQSHSAGSAAEMLLIRLAYVSELPTPDELQRAVAAVINDDSAAPVVKQRGVSIAPPAPADTARENGQQREFATFAEVISALRDKRERLLCNDLEQFVMPHQVRDGYLKLALSANAPADLTTKLRTALNQHLGGNWQLDWVRDEKTVPAITGAAQEPKDTAAPAPIADTPEHQQDPSSARAAPAPIAGAATTAPTLAAQGAEMENQSAPPRAAAIAAGGVSTPANAQGDTAIEAAQATPLVKETLQLFPGSRVVALVPPADTAQ